MDKKTITHMQTSTRLSAVNAVYLIITFQLGYEFCLWLGFDKLFSNFKLVYYLIMFVIIFIIHLYYEKAYKQELKESKD